MKLFIISLYSFQDFGKFIKYLRTLGFNVTNDIFAENAWYFRNALVRANYTNLQKNIHETTEYLELFLRNLLLDEKNELRNRTMHISGYFSEKVDIGTKKVDIGAEKVDIGIKKVDIGTKKVDIGTIDFSKRTMQHIETLYDEYGYNQLFGRSDVMKLVGLKSSAVSNLISKLLQVDIIEPVTGHGKGKYKFKHKV